MNSKMPPPPPHLTYLKTLQLVADQSRRELTALIPHMGERGRVAEDIIRNVLHRILPKRFSIGTGIIISASGESSMQTDIIIFDNFYNSPLLSEFGVGIFPVEIVYATIEVKSTLTKSTLEQSLTAIRKLRELGRKKYYDTPVTCINPKGSLTLASRKLIMTVPPRSYVVAFEKRGLGNNYTKFCKTLKSCLDREDDHIHGVSVLDNDWFVGRIPHKIPTQLFCKEENSLFYLYSSILEGQNNFAVYPLDLDEYLNRSQS